MNIVHVLLHTMVSIRHWGYSTKGLNFLHQGFTDTGRLMHSGSTFLGLGPPVPRKRKVIPPSKGILPLRTVMYRVRGVGPILAQEALPLLAQSVLLGISQPSNVVGVIQGTQGLAQMCRHLILRSELRFLRLACTSTLHHLGPSWGGRTLVAPTRCRCTRP